VTPLDSIGNKVWPNVQDDADFVFVDAVSTAEVVARKPANRKVMVKGEFVSIPEI